MAPLPEILSLASILLAAYASKINTIAKIPLIAALTEERIVMENEELKNKFISFCGDEKYKKFKLHGGIVANTSKDYSGNWKIYKSTNRTNLRETNKTGWELLDFKETR